MITTIAQTKDLASRPIDFLKFSNLHAVAANFHNSNRYGSVPNGTTTPASGVAGAALTNPTVIATASPLFWRNPLTGETVVSSVRNNMVSGSEHGNILLIDRLWENSGLSSTLTTAQTVNSVAWTARDINQSTNGDGVFIAVEQVTTSGVGTPTLTISYTNSDGVAGRTGTNIVATQASTPIGTFQLFSLQAGDTGVRSVQSYTASATRTSGTFSLVAFRPICEVVRIAITSNPTVAYQVTDCLSLCAPRIWNDSWLELVHMSGGTATETLQGSITLSQG